jgi:hypothetical protein
VTGYTGLALTAADVRSTERQNIPMFSGRSLVGPKVRTQRDRPHSLRVRRLRTELRRDLEFFLRVRAAGGNGGMIDDDKRP